ncbi:hypothetical protein GF336_06530 [Candidatus Woesearchaeota archaeon]|nr:hypothetical protein [Candidatus Woesearchaeota archaeon]
MGKRFIQRIPKKPVFKKNTYEIPKSYTDSYERAGITDSYEQKMLFHLTQFGGFRAKKVTQEMNSDKDFLDRWFKQSYDNGFYNFRANTAFIQKFGDVELKPLLRTWQIDCLNEDEMKECGFSKKEINESFDFLYKLNKFYSDIRIDIRIPKTGMTAKDLAQIQKFHGIPFLVKKPRAGGRFFHPGTSYQRISSSLRPFMTINDEKTAELDLTAATIQFLDIIMKESSMGSLEDTVLSHDDPYQYFMSTIDSYKLMQAHEASAGREEVKDILYTAIYSPKNRQKANVDRKLMEKYYSHSILVSLFPEFFNPLYRLKSKKKEPLHMIINKEESRYAQNVLQKACLEKSIPMMPIHDSFVAPKHRIKELEKCMNDASYELYGKKLPYKRKY